MRPTALVLVILWEHILLLQAIAFKIPAHLGVVSYTIYADVKHTSGLISGCGIQLLFPTAAEDCDL